MKRFLFAILILGLTANYMFSQVDAHFSLFEYTQNIVNPGATGGNDAMCFTTSHRQQWVGFKVKNINSGSTETTDESGRPISTIFSFDMPINKIHSGLGIAVLQDKIGFQNDIQVKLNYAYRISIGEAATLGVGVGLGVVNRNINPNWVTWEELVNNGTVYGDPSLPHMENVTVFDMNLGISMFGKDFWAGLSCTHLTSPKMNYKSVVVASRLVQQFYLMGGYTFHLSNPSYDILTSALIQTDRISKVDFQINAKLMYEKKFWAGLSGRIDAIVPMVGVHLALGPGAISLAYCYDIKLNKIGAGGSHELMARYCFNLAKGDKLTRVRTIRRL